MSITFGSVCSGIESASVAWHPLGWCTAWVAEIDPFPCAVLAHHYPDVPNHGDFTTIQANAGPIDLLVGGTPCQSFSVAGLRKGMADNRGNLALEFLRLAGRLQPRWVLWENVPGVLSNNGGRDFGSFLRGLVELGYGFSYRVLDAQYVRVDGFGRAVPQRRRRVFVVGYLGDWRHAAAVLFERESLSGNSPPGREAGQGVAGSLTGSLGRRCGVPDGGDTRGQLVVDTLTSHHGRMRPDETYVAHSLRADGFDASEDGTGRGTPLVPLVASTLFSSNGGVSSGYHPVIPIDMRQASRGATMTNNRADGSSGGAPGTGIGEPGDPSPSLSLSHPPAIAYPIQNATRGKGQNGLGIGEPDAPIFTLDNASHHAIAFQERGRAAGRTLEWQEDVSYALRALDGGGCSDWFRVAYRWAVRRLTPLECERLQGFPDGYTLIPYRGKLATDGPRYKAIGNSISINLIRWLGVRIQIVNDLYIGKAPS